MLLLFNVTPTLVLTNVEKSVLSKAHANQKDLLLLLFLTLAFKKLRGNEEYTCKES